MLQLGFKPQALRVLLTTGADLQFTLERTTGTFPVTAGMSLAFGSGATVTAAMTTTTATFSSDKAVMDAVPDGDTVRLKYTDGTTDLTWALGSVTRCG